MALAVLEFSDLSEPQRVKIDLPTVHLGDRIRLAFTLRRKRQGRDEMLSISGEYKVMNVLLEARSHPHQIIQVASTGVSPAWKAIKSTKAKRLAPAKSVKTIVG
jgi:hypothetical protein